MNRLQIVVIAVGVVSVALFIGWVVLGENGTASTDSAPSATSVVTKRGVPSQPKAPNAYTGNENAQPANVASVAPTQTGQARTFADGRPRSYSEIMWNRLRPTMARFTKAMQVIELARTKLETKEGPNGIITIKAVIPPASQDEIKQFQALFSAEWAKLPEDVKPFFAVDGQRFLDKYGDEFHGKSKVVYLNQTHSDAGKTKMAFPLWSFETDEPGKFGIKPDGSIQAPAGVAIGASTPFFDADGKPNPRYSHLFPVKGTTSH